MNRLPFIACQKCGHSINFHRDNQNGKRECDLCRCKRTQWFIAKQDRLYGQGGISQ